MLTAVLFVIDPVLLPLGRREAYTGQWNQASMELSQWVIRKANHSAFATVLVFGSAKERSLLPTGEFRAMNRMHSQNPLREPGAWHAYR